MKSWLLRHHQSLPMLTAFCILAGCAQPGQTSSKQSPSQGNTQANSYRSPKLSQDLQSQVASRPVVPKKLSAADVFFATSEQFALYDSEALDRIACYLEFGDQLLIRQRLQDSLKVRIDLYAINRRACPEDLTYGYVKSADQLQIPEIPGDVLSLDQDGIPAYAELSDEEPVCFLKNGVNVLVTNRIGLDHTQIDIPSDSCDNGYAGLAVIKDSKLLPFAERYHRYPKYKAYTLAHDIKVYADADRSTAVLCTLARGNSILEVEENNALQMPVSTNCDADYLIAYYHYFSGIWLEEHPD